MVYHLSPSLPNTVKEINESYHTVGEYHLDLTDSESCVLILSIEPSSDPTKKVQSLQAKINPCSIFNKMEMPRFVNQIRTWQIKVIFSDWYTNPEIHFMHKIIHIGLNTTR